MKVLSLTLVALAGTANAGYSGSAAAQTPSINQFESWFTDEFRRLTTSAMHMKSVITNSRGLASHTHSGTGGATGGAFAPTCKKPKEDVRLRDLAAHEHHYKCTKGVYDPLKGDNTDPSDANCCKFKPTCNKPKADRRLRDLAAHEHHYKCKAGKYDPKKGDNADPSDANCCTKAAFVPTCAEPKADRRLRDLAAHEHHYKCTTGAYDVSKAKAVDPSDANCCTQALAPSSEDISAGFMSIPAITTFALAVVAAAVTM